MKNLLFDRHAIAVKKTKQQQQMKKKKNPVRQKRFYRYNSGSRCGSPARR